jgi:acyl-CoA reductase-like NAD-dependent aldehyde dehydrogenase
VSRGEDRLPVRKTYKLYVGGAFPRSESGRSYPVTAGDGSLAANVVRASRKDLRDAVVAARKAYDGWATRAPFNRGQVLYRVAEVMEGRRAQFVDEVAAGGASRRAAEREVDVAVDRWVWYAGWADKIAHVAGTVNPVAGPYVNFTSPEPMGVVGVVCPDEAPLLALVSRLAPAITGGNTVVLLASQRWPLPAVTLSEALATSDVPGGVVNVLTGHRSELVPWLAGHLDVDAVDLTGVDDDALATEAEAAAAENVKRVVRATPAERDWTEDRAQSPYAVTALMEMKTVWHPKGA